MMPREICRYYACPIESDSHMFKKNSAHIRLAPVEGRPFYLPGDCVTGKLLLDLESPLSYKDIQVKIRCDEVCTISTDRSVMNYQFEVGVRKPDLGKRDVKERAIKRTDSIMPQTVYDKTLRHFGLTTTIANQHSPEASSHETVLPAGQHSFEFSILLPHTVSKCPPSCDIKEGQGVYWTLKAVVHRSGIKKNLRKELALPVYPTQHVVHELPNWNSFDELVGTRVFDKEGNHVLNARLQYLSSGLPQPLPNFITPNFSLLLDAPQKPLLIHAVSLNLVLTCEAALDNKALKNSTIKEISLGRAHVNQLAEPKLDLTPLVKEFGLRKMQAQNFVTDYLNVSYKLQLVIESEGRMTIEKDIAVVAPELCWETRKLPSYDDVTNYGGRE